MSKHTPGPWRDKASIHGSEFRYVQIGAEEGYTTCELNPADARLIAAAPELLEALRKLTLMARTSGGTPGPDGDLMKACEVAEAAIAKAEAA